MDLVAGNYEEIKLVQLAEKKSANPEIKDVASYLEKEHNAVLNELKDLAGKKKFTIPTEESDKGKERIKALTDADAKDFDKRWCEELMDKHKKSIEKLETREITDADLKAWVNEVLPKLRMHHDRLMQCHSKLK